MMKRALESRDETMQLHIVGLAEELPLDDRVAHQGKLLRLTVDEVKHLSATVSGLSRSQRRLKISAWVLGVFTVIGAVTGVWAIVLYYLPHLHK
jgi:hypothetical protein